MILRDEADELIAHDAGVVSRLQGYDADQDQALHLDLGLHDGLELIGDGKEDDVRETDTVEGRDERGGDRLTELFRLVEVAQYRDEPENGSDDSHRRAETAGLLEDRGFRLLPFLVLHDLDLEDAVDRRGVDAVDDEAEAPLDEGVVFLGGELRLHVFLEAQKPFLARLFREGDEEVDDLLVVEVR